MVLDRDSRAGTLHLVLEGRMEAGTTVLSAKEHNKVCPMSNVKLFPMAVVVGLLDRRPSSIRSAETGNQGFDHFVLLLN